MPSEKKILFTTRFRKNNLEWGSADGYYDYLGGYGYYTSFFRFTIPWVFSQGLRFIKQNIPDIEILEYPTWEEYTKKIDEGWDIVGYSFYLTDTPDIKRMIGYAQKQGVEIWGGNFGVLQPNATKMFDKIFYGYAEEEIAKTLGKNIDHLKHPPLPMYISTPIHLKINMLGGLYTSRGCSIGCKFCQTTAVCNKPHKVPIDSIDQILRYYKQVGIDEIIILDDNFGIFKDHSNQVIELLNKYDFYWYTMTRVDFVYNNFHKWCKKGFNGSFIGLESLSQKTLDEVNKKTKVSNAIDLINLSNKHNRLIVGFYIIGYENDTEESLKKDMKKIRNLHLDIFQPMILTPYPETKFWTYIKDTYGLSTTDYSKFDTKHLVWNHPNFISDQLEKLQMTIMKNTNTAQNFFRITKKMFIRYLNDKGKLTSAPYLFKRINTVNSFDFLHHPSTI